MKITIVTLSFNQRAYLQQAIDSVLSQGYRDLEYIVVDPGSSDGSRELIRSYGPQVAHTVFEPDHGPADGLNKGFSRASGEVLGFLNSDDVLYPGAICSAVSFFRSHPEVDVVSGHANILSADEDVLRRAYSDRMSVLKYLYGGAVIIQPSTFFRRTAFQKVGGFNVKNRVSWDGELFLDMALMGCKFALCDGIWSGYRLHPGTITESKSRLDQARRESEAGQFRRVFGRDWNKLDNCFSAAVRIWKHVANPRDTVERILRGPISGRTV